MSTASIFRYTARIVTLDGRATLGRSLAAAAALLLCCLPTSGLRAQAAGAGPAAPADPFLWLEAVHGKRALRWVAAENRKTLAVLERDPRYAQLFSQALSIAEAKDRLPVPQYLSGRLFNFWRDGEHVRGIWRVTTREDYRNPQPDWKTVLDLDALAASEHANWFWGGAECLPPAETRCLVTLSDGGEDASTAREFDLATQRFVPSGFALPTSKQTAVWVDADDLLVARDWGAGSMTASGYPFVVKRLRRGQALADAVEIFRGASTDVAVELLALHDGAGHQANFLVRAVSFFETEIYLVGDQGPVRLALPGKANVDDLLEGRLLVTLNEDWTVGGATLQRGSLVALDLAAVRADPAHLEPKLVYQPGPHESLGEAIATRSALIVTSYEDVKGRAAIYTPGAAGSWARRALPLPDLASIHVVTADAFSDDAIVNVTSFLRPSTYWRVDAARGEAVPLKELPPRFDARGLLVEQRWATSKDGTRIPYFVVRPKDLPLDGRAPTILTAYGGFQVSETPRYVATMGKTWLERGGVFVVANIRGGGEFGPDWHEAGLKTQRQRVYDDFAAVAEDLIRERITSPRHLGIEGGSNGGLLMGVEFTQHPDLWNAVSIEVPLLDMLRYEQIAAGASWVGEYGSVSVPAERAFLASISPYQHLRRGVHYPRPLIWTTTKDDRVGPQHARKFAARLASIGAPYLYYEVTEGGHGAGASLREEATTTALEMTYFTRQLVDR